MIAIEDLINTAILMSVFFAGLCIGYLYRRDSSKIKSDSIDW